MEPHSARWRHDVPLKGKRVAILATDGVEEIELNEPRKALDAAGAETTLVSPKTGTIKGWQHDQWGGQIRVDLALDDAREEDFDALMLPGGVMNPDHLRVNQNAVEFVRNVVPAVFAVLTVPWAKAAIANALKHSVAANFFICVFLLIVGLL